MQVRILCKRITKRGFVVYEEADRFSLQLIQIESCGKANLHG